MDNTYFTRKRPVLKSFDKKIFVNQTGYHPSRLKQAVIKSPCKTFYIKDQNGNIKYQNNVNYFGLDNDSQDNIYLADFSAFNEEGLFYVETDKGDTSINFEIGKTSSEKVFHDVCKAFYYLRCGTSLDKAHAGIFTHEICHSKKAFEWNNHNVCIDVSGGWHDAGDYGRYVTAACCALAHLLFAFQMFEDVFISLNMNIPESGQGLPDILSECKYELDWLLKMQKCDGSVYHKATTAHHAPFIMPEDDKEQMYVFSVSSIATADFAAICALASRIYKKYDKEYSQKLIDAAKKSYDWLDLHPQFLGFENPKGCNTGVYGEREDNDNRFWASAEMFCTLNEEKYHNDMKKALEKEFPLCALGYGSTAGFGAFSYIFSDSDKDKALCERFKSAFTCAAERFKKDAENCGYGAAMRTQDYCWGSNMNLLKRAMIFIIADKIKNNDNYTRFICAQYDYLLGVNALGFSYVTGNGEFACNYPHLRPSHADGIEECIPGMVSGGPNRFPADIDAKALIKPNTPPMKCYADDVGCYSLNEITIYWNSPAVFLTAYIEDKFSQ